MCSVSALKIGQFAATRRQANAFAGVLIGMVLLVPTGLLRGAADKETVAARVARLIGQLGDDHYTEREAASSELAAIGEPALAALRQAAASHRDPETRSRAQRVIRVIAERADRNELAKWAGFWKTPAGEWLEIMGDRWSGGAPMSATYTGRIWIIDIGKTRSAADMLVEQGPTKGQIVRAIFRLDGDNLHYCGTYTAGRATEFKTVRNYQAYAYKRSKRYTVAGKPCGSLRRRCGHLAGGRGGDGLRREFVLRIAIIIDGRPPTRPALGRRSFDDVPVLRRLLERGADDRLVDFQSAHCLSFRASTRRRPFSSSSSWAALRWFRRSPAGRRCKSDT